MSKHNGHTVPSPLEGSNYADGRLESAPSEDAGELLTQMAARADISLEKAAELYELVEEHVGAIRISAQTGHSNEKAFALMVFRGLRICAAGRSSKLQAFAMKCLMLVLGRGEDLGVSTPTELARKLKITKQNVDRIVCQLRDVLPEGGTDKRLPEARGQRTVAQRDAFRRERERQEAERMQRTKESKLHI